MALASSGTRSSPSVPVRIALIARVVPWMNSSAAAEELLERDRRGRRAASRDRVEDALDRVVRRRRALKRRETPSPSSTRGR